ncbi:MAG: flagellar assembly protein FliH [Zoogloeaceae bacterium]|jgi:flagellar assembly protein FliH|nr:flagellar assembly protein FliH [Zoogloeaceae bacterium]
MAGNVIPGEISAAAAYTRWQAEDFARPSSPSPAAPRAETVEERRAVAGDGEVEVSHIGSVPLPTAEDIERIHEEARQSGYRSGLEAGHEEGYEKGYAKGYEEGRGAGFQEGGAAGQAYEEEIRRLCQGLQEALAALDQEIAEAVLACALEAAGQMTRSAIRVKPELLLPTIREALAALPLRHEPVTLLLAPEDATVLREHLGNQFAQEGWHIQEDNSILPGGCLLRAGTSEIDARVESRWRRILEAIGLSQEWLANKP